MRVLNKPGNLALLCLALILALNIPIFTVGGTPAPEPFEGENYAHILSKLNMTAIKSHIEFMSHVGSRMTGYVGYEKAAEYILDTFRRYGLNEDNSYFEYYDVAVPVEVSSSVEVLSPEKITLKAYALAPNLVETCKTPIGGVVGRLIYAGGGSLEDFDGQDVDGSIVLMDFNCEGNWTRAAMLGAKAVIFIEPEEYTSIQAEQNLIDVPLYFPRVLISKEEGLYLQRIVSEYDNVMVRVSVNFNWEKIKAKNVIAKIPGLYSDRAIIIATHFDSYSVVPSLNPGASDAAGAALLLELAKIFFENPPKHTLLLVAFSGHYQGLAGAREFVEAHFNEIGNPFILFINLDFTPDSSTLVVGYCGYFYDFWDSVVRLGGVRSLIFDSNRGYIQEIKRQLPDREYDIKNGLSTDSWLSYFAMPIISESEVYLQAGGSAITFGTGYVRRVRQGTPADTYEGLLKNFNNLQLQLEPTFLILYSLANEDQISAYNVPTRYVPIRSSGGFCTLKGQVLEFNRRTGWYEKVPYAIVHATLVSPSAVLGGGLNPLIQTWETQVTLGYTGFFIFNVYTIADENGYFEIHGVPSGNTWNPEQAWMTADSMIYLEAYVLNSSGGPLIRAPDFGLYGVNKYPNAFMIFTGEQWQNIVVFQCGSIAIYDMVVPLIKGVALPFITPTVQLIEGHVTPDSYSWRRSSIGKDITIIFVPPNMKIEIYTPNGLLLNASKDYKEGYGFRVAAGELLTITNTPLRAANDLRWLNEHRLNIAAQHAVFGVRAMEYHAKAFSLIENSIENLDSHIYSTAYSQGLAALNYGLIAYQETKNLLLDVIYVLMIYFTLLIPFSFLTDIFLFGEESKGTTKLARTIIIFVIFMVLLFSGHPAFKLAANVPMVLVGCTIVAFIAPVLFLLILHYFKSLMELRRKTIGVHFIEVSRLGLFTHAFSAGARNIRRRGLRSVLVLTSITLVTFALVSFTSFQVRPLVLFSSFPSVATQEGILIRDINWDPLTQSLAEYVKVKYKDEASVAIRMWLTPLSMTPLVISPSGIKATPASLLGLEPSEKEVSFIDKTLIEGRWFEPKDYYACIMSDVMAEKLQVHTGSKVTLWGLVFTIVGIFDHEVYDAVMFDLSQELMTPRELGAFGSETVTHMPSENVLIVTYDFLKTFPTALIKSIGLKPYNASIIPLVAKDIAFSIPVSVYYGVDGQPIQHLMQKYAFRFAGVNLTLIPLAIASFILFNTMLGSVYERKREIGIYSSIGVSPSQIMGIFLAETLLYAVVGSVFGYTIGIITVTVMNLTGALPAQFYPNYSSLPAVISVAAVIASTLASATYPAFLSSKISVPSLERAWKPSTKPRGDEWYLTLPIKIREEESLGFISFIYEFYDAHRSEIGGRFVVSDIVYEETEETKILFCNVHLAPFEHGVNQSVRLRLTPMQKGIYGVEIYLKRLTGLAYIWRKASYNFVDDLRKQIIIWGSLSPSEKQIYADKFRKLGLTPVQPPKMGSL